MIRYYDIHTHNLRPESECLSIFNRYEHFDAINEGMLCSVGLHPWYLDHAAADIVSLKERVQSVDVIAIGECGLDKIRGAAWDRQMHFFEQQILLANECYKPLIIHCVRAYEETLNMLQQAKVPVIFHGFNKKMPVAQCILSAGHYLSFGAALLKPGASAVDVWEQAPVTQCFLETDDATVSIRDVYAAAAGIRKTGEDALILQLEQNFKNVFRK